MTTPAIRVGVTKMPPVDDGKAIKQHANKSSAIKA